MKSDNQIVVVNAPKIPELSFRHFCGESDYASIAAVLTASSRADNVERSVTAEDVATVFANYLTNCDPYADMVIAEIAGEMVGYWRGWWTEEAPLTRLYNHNGFLLPEWRRKGIGPAMLDWMERRLIDISATHPRQHKKYFQVNVSQSQESVRIMLEEAGYRPVRYFYQMLRPNLEDILDYPLPDGLEIRPVTPDHYPAIWQSMHASSQEEWGATEPTKEAYQEWQSHPHFQPDLWQIAWELGTNHPVGHVLTYIDHEENQQFDRKRGYTEGIGVSPEWRRRGVARALISLSLRAQKKAGMSESALVADGESASGATSLYESCGFQVVDRDTIYRKEL
jgi:mycothiol synthase